MLEARFKLLSILPRSDDDCNALDDRDDGETDDDCNCTALDDRNDGEIDDDCNALDDRDDGEIDAANGRYDRMSRSRNFIFNWWKILIVC